MWPTRKGPPWYLISAPCNGGMVRQAAGTGPGDAADLLALFWSVRNRSAVRKRRAAWPILDSRDPEEILGYRSPR